MFGGQGMGELNNVCCVYLFADANGLRWDTMRAKSRGVSSKHSLISTNFDSFLHSHWIAYLKPLRFQRRWFSFFGISKLDFSQEIIIFVFTSNSIKFLLFTCNRFDLSEKTIGLKCKWLKCNREEHFCWTTFSRHIQSLIAPPIFWPKSCNNIWRIFHTENYVVNRGIFRNYCLRTLRSESNE